MDIMDENEKKDLLEELQPVKKEYQLSNEMGDENEVDPGMSNSENIKDTSLVEDPRMVDGSSDSTDPDLSNKPHMNLSLINEFTEGIQEKNNEIAGKLSILLKQQIELLDEFKLRLSVDKHKNNIIDNLHTELQSYKEGLVEKIQKPIFMALISYIDDLRKTTDRLESEDFDKQKMLHEYKKMGCFLEDLLFNFGIEPYESEIGSTFNPKEQRCVSKKYVVEEEKHKTIHKVSSPGFKWDEKVIKLESVELNIFNKE